MSMTPTTSSSVQEGIDFPSFSNNATKTLPNTTQASTEELTILDIEHVAVDDDPRLWSRKRKTFTLAIVSTATLISTLGINIYNPAINSVKADLHATDQQISLSLSVFILVQGITPLFWSAISEIHGRKLVYLVSIGLYLVGCGIAGSARSIGVLIAMRIVQAIGGSAVATIGAATLADIYEPKERGTVVGIYYAAPLLGPSIGPLIGGVATQLFSWRATFYFLVIFAGLSMIMFLFLKDTFRKERSLSYQVALQAALKDREHKMEKARRRASKDEKRTVSPDLEASSEHTHPMLEDMRLSLRDVNPIRPLSSVLKQKNNLTILLPSSLLFAFSYCLTYTSVLTFAAAPYFYNSLQLGLVLLSYGAGSILGSIMGGRWSDHILRRIDTLKGKATSEDRLRSGKPMMLVLPPALLMYAWMAQEKVNIAGVCVALFLSGFSSLWIYSSTLAYIVDANVGRSSTAVATNSFSRGFAGFVAAEVAVPLQHTLGDGGLYTLWAGLMVIMSFMILLTIAKGGKWREEGTRKEEEESRSSTKA